MQVTYLRGAVIGMLLTAIHVYGQEKKNDPTVPKVVITRADLAKAYLRFDAAFVQHPPPADKLADVNIRFDTATKAFFGGSLAKVSEGVSGLTAELLPTVTAPKTQALVNALKVRILPPMHIHGDPSVPIAWIRPVYTPDNASSEPGDYVLRFSKRDGTTAAEIPFLIGSETKEPLRIPLPEKVSSLPVGKYEVTIGAKGIEPVVQTPWYVVAENIDLVRERNAKQLAAIPTSDQLQQSIATCKARNALLVSSPSETNSAEFLANPLELSKEVSAEIEMLQHGKDPYANRIGDYWRVIVEGQTTIPFRVYAPESIRGKKDVPLVIALHGAGGDENMFMDAYGQGEIKKLADKNGFLLVTPATFFFAVNAKYFDLLVDTLKTCYPIDPSRIYVLGHSMGAGATAFLARQRADKIAATCCLAGGRGFPTKGAFSPTLVIAAELDGLIPLDALRSGVEPAKAAGMPIEFRVLPNYGHTIMVGNQLPIAIDWLLPQRLGKN